MTFDFDQIIDRRDEGSIKWDCGEKELPMWVADMDFAVAPAVLEAMKKRISHPCFGYTSLPKDWAAAYADFWKDEFGAFLNEDALLFSLGIIPSLSSSIRAFSAKGDEVVLLTPVYNVFNHSVENNGRVVVPCPLLNKNENYSIDWAALEKALSSPKAKILVLCNPHNPIGRIWDKDELRRIATLCKEHHVLVISDEVHGPIHKEGFPYVPYMSVSDEARNNSIALLAPTKSFNVAGVQTSACYAENGKIRAKLAFCLNADEVAEGNFLSYAVSTACFKEGRVWLKEMNAYVQKNYEWARSFLQAKLPKLKIAPLQATYLAWIDTRAYSVNDVAFCEKLRKETGLWVTPGSTYGKEGEGHIRVNLACPFSRIEDGFLRLLSFCEKLL